VGAALPDVGVAERDILVQIRGLHRPVLLESAEHLEQRRPKASDQLLSLHNSFSLKRGQAGCADPGRARFWSSLDSKATPGPTPWVLLLDAVLVGQEEVRG